MIAARVLLVDDDSMMLKVLSLLLIRQGYEVLPASGSREALEIIKNDGPVDIIVSDILMPEMPGTELIREVATLSPGTAGVLITGAAIAQFDLPNGVPVLEKPFSIEELTHVIKTRLAQWTAFRAGS